MQTILISVLFFFQTSIYTLSFTDADNNVVNMNNYHGKKILLVNIATSSALMNQVNELQQLQTMYGDSLVIIAFPSNSFGHETRNNIAIKNYLQQHYRVTFLIAAKGSVAGPDAQLIYQWLSNQTENGMMSGVTGANFQKFLINEQGQLVGRFAHSVSPMSEMIRNAIETNYN